MIIALLIYISICISCVALWAIFNIFAIQKKPAKKTTVTIIPDGEFDRAIPTKNGSRVIPLTDEYEYDQSTKFKNLSNR